MRAFYILTLFCITLILTSCEQKTTQPPPNKDWLCKINADGTGFQRLVKGTDLSIWGSMYVTQDEKIIFEYGLFYIVSAPTWSPIAISDTLNDDYKTRISLSNHTNKAYFCNRGDLFEYNLSNNSRLNLTENYEGNFTNAIISPNDKIITMTMQVYRNTSQRYLCYYDLSSDSLYTILGAGTTTNNGIYNPHDNKLYHAQDNGLYRIDLNGSNNTLLLSLDNVSNLNRDHSFALTLKNDHIVVCDRNNVLRIFDLNSNRADFICGFSYSHALFYPPICNRTSNSVTFEKNGSIYIYNLNNDTLSSIPHINMSGHNWSTWDSNTIYYYSSVEPD